MRRLMLGAATAAIAVTTACSMLGKQAFQQPVVQLKDVAVQGVGLTGGQLAVKLNVYNPNGYRLDATRLSYNVLVGDNVNLANGTLDGQWSVNSGDSTTVTIPVSFTYAGIGAAGRQMMNSGSVPYRVNGDVTVGTVVGNFTVPYSSSGNFTAFGGNTRR
ncbi:MAG: Late embryosis abundant protein 2 [Gemmatimonadetes bacterium]|jgi:LEA14-like dessication related protein|nr:Late embryosis abundant protein 2 [Gemmatimonadota bacterium]